MRIRVFVSLPCFSSEFALRSAFPGEHARLVQAHVIHELVIGARQLLRVYCLSTHAPKSTLKVGIRNWPAGF